MAVIELAKITDILTLNKISFQSKAFWNYPDEWLEKWKEELTITPGYLQKHILFKLVIDNQIIGFCAIEERVSEYEIAHLWILPEYIGKGFGKFLLKEAMKKTIVKNKEVIVVADPFAEKFYKKMGFVTFDQKESYPKGRFLPVMRKKM